uniref:Serine/threonine-protein phosphatase 4 regulatory subunit 1 n=1 Tax=Parascaris univalens TaxID=6257 RepID=A0A915ACP5_PARUN
MAFINQDHLMQTPSHSDAQFDGDVEMDDDGACEFDGADGSPHERSDFECFMYYATSPSIGDTEVAVRSVAKTMHTLDPDSDRRSLERLMRAIESIFERDDDSQIRCIILEQIPTIYLDFSNSDAVSARIHEVFSCVIVDCIVHFSDQVWKCVIGTIGVLLEQHLLTREALEEQICPALLEQTCHHSGCQAYIVSDEHRVEALTLLCKIITCRGTVSRQWIFDVFTPRLSLLLQDSVFHVRKISASILGDVASIFGRNFTEQFIVPFLTTLSRDPIWGVRKACCEVFVEVAQKCSSRVKETQLAPRFIELLKDSSRWVCFAAFQQLGPFIATFADSTRTGLEIRNGRLAFTDDSSQSLCTTETEPDGMEASWLSDFEYSVLPSDVCLPSDAKTEPSPAELLAADDQILSELTGLLDSWTLDQNSGSARSAHSSLTDVLDGTLSAAAACSTQNDLSKLVFDDDDRVADDEDLMDIEEEHANTKIVMVGEKAEDFGELSYWSKNFIDVDMECYGRKAISSDSDSYMERRISMLYRHSDDVLLQEGTGDCHLDVEGSSNSGLLQNGNLVSASVTSYDSKDIVPKELLDSYVKRVSPCGTNEPDINRHCAHSFPAVAFTLGRRNWPQLQETYAQLASDMQWRVRQSLASSMHEVAAIIGEENADAHLVPVFEQFMKDVEDVRLGLLKHLYDFFKLVTPGTRKKLLTVLASFLHSDAENERNWRSRHEYTRQCALLCDLYDVNDVNEYIAAIALTLATDRVASVRDEAASLLARVLSKFVRYEWRGQSAHVEIKTIPVTASFANDTIKGFARSKNWRRRQTFVKFCAKTLEFGQVSVEQFEFLLLPELVHLSADGVPNIRLAFARAMFCTRGGEVFRAKADRENVRDALEVMLDDSDSDCRRTARKALGMPDSESNFQIKDGTENLGGMESVLQPSLLGNEAEGTPEQNYGIHAE